MRRGLRIIVTRAALNSFFISILNFSKKKFMNNEHELALQGVRNNRAIEHIHSDDRISNFIYTINPLSSS